MAGAIELWLAFFLALVAAGVFFVVVEQGFFAALFFLAALFLFIARAIVGTGKAAKATVGGGTKGMWLESAEAKTSGPAFGVMEEGVKNAADMAEQQLVAGEKAKGHNFRGDQYQFRFKGWGVLGEACQKLIDSFHKVFK